MKLGAIYPRVPEVYACQDGTFSTARLPYACSRRGGRMSDTPVNTGTGSGSALLNIVDVPLAAIHIDRSLFQGREKAYSERSVTNIIDAVKSGSFVWANLDPVTLWRDAAGRLYLLSGHSRFHAFQLLAKAGAQVDGKRFDRIPAKIRTGDLAAAQRLALESNTLATKETDIERAAYYMRLRAQGAKESDIRAQIKRNEDRNAPNIYAYTFLSPTGRTWAAIKAIGDGADQTATLIKSFGRWIGTARARWQGLTTAHENELFAWLVDAKGYGTGSNQISNERDFLGKVEYFIQKNTFLGRWDNTQPLNIMAAQQKTPVEMAYDARIQEAQKKVQDLEKGIKEQTRELTARNATKNDLARILAPIEAQLRNARADLQTLLLKRSEVVEYAKKEATLFGIGRIIPPWASATDARRGCRRPGYSTTTLGAGGCSWHGGYRRGEYDATAANWRAGMKRALRAKGYSVPESEGALYAKYRQKIGPYPTLSTFRQSAVSGCGCGCAGACSDEHSLMVV